MVALNLTLFLAAFLPVVSRDGSLLSLRGHTLGKPENTTEKYVARTENVITRFPPTAEESAAVDAVNARRAADSAAEAAPVASRVADHSAVVTKAAASALRDVRQSLKEARTETDGVTADQAETLKRAETQLKLANDFRARSVSSRYVKAGDASVAADADDVERLHKLQRELDATLADADAHSREGEVLRMEADIQRLKGDLAEKKEIWTNGAQRSDAESSKEVASELAEIEAMVRELEAADRVEGHDELKVTVERLRQRVQKLEARQAAEPLKPDAGSLNFELPPRKEVPLRKVKESPQAKLPLREVGAECKQNCP